MNVRKMHFHRWNGDGRQGVSYGDAGMSIGGRIDDNTLINRLGLLDPRDQLPLVIRLANVEFDSQFMAEFGERLIDSVKRRRSIDGRLAITQQIQVRSMEDQHPHHNKADTALSPRLRFRPSVFPLVGGIVTLRQNRVKRSEESYGLAVRGTLIASAQLNGGEPLFKPRCNDLFSLKRSARLIR